MATYLIRQYKNSESQVIIWIIFRRQKKIASSYIKKAISSYTTSSLERNAPTHGTRGFFLGLQIHKFRINQMAIRCHKCAVAIVLVQLHKVYPNSLNIV